VFSRGDRQAATDKEMSTLRPSVHVQFEPADPVATNGNGIYVTVSKSLHQTGGGEFRVVQINVLIGILKTPTLVAMVVKCRNFNTKLAITRLM